MGINYKRRVDAWPARSNASHNPFQSLLSDALEKEGWQVREFSPLRALFTKSLIWHWHWPDGQFGHKRRSVAWLRLIVLLLLLLKARLVKTQIIWTAHNLRGHESKHRIVENRFWPIFYRSISGIHFLSEASRDAALQIYPCLSDKPYVITPHGHYRDAIGAAMSKTAARAALGVDESALTLVFCGKIKAYKGVVDLIEAFRNVYSTDLRLIVAGVATPDEEPLVRAAASHDSRVHLILKLLSNDEIAMIVSAADLVVLPYKAVTNSGSALLALSLNRPILAANKGSIPELAQRLGHDWVATFEELSADSITEHVRAAAQRRGDAVNLDFFDWQHIGKRVAALYQEVSDAPMQQGEPAPRDWETKK